MNKFASLLIVSILTIGVATEASAAFRIELGSGRYNSEYRECYRNFNGDVYCTYNNYPYRQNSYISIPLFGSGDWGHHGRDRHDGRHHGGHGR